MSYFLSPPPFPFPFTFVSLFHNKGVNQNAKTGAKLKCHFIFISTEGGGVFEHVTVCLSMCMSILSMHICSVCVCVCVTVCVSL